MSLRISGKNLSLLCSREYGKAGIRPGIEPPIPRKLLLEIDIEILQKSRPARQVGQSLALKQARERACAAHPNLFGFAHLYMSNEVKGMLDDNSTGGMRGSATKLFVEAVSPSMRSVEGVIRELAARELPVLLVAESGAGKHAAARLVHELSHRKSESFQAVSCLSLSPELLKSSAQSLWGAGTVYLEELADLPMASQAQLFQLMSGEGNGHARLQARLICGTSRDLESEVKAGRLREDLYYRVSGVCLRIPPLRQRKEDIPRLVDFFLEKYSREFHSALPALSEPTRVLFQDYAWPGNIRELEDAAKALVALGDESVAMGGLRSMLQKVDRGSERVSLKQAARAASREAERELILRVLTRTRWNRRRAAQELQISYKALLYKLKQIGCEEYGTP